ncbi:MAG: hypothetical protein HQK89_01935 [Nitrospirae bacterium]|nr:hypothetical protein [Nitrospirota bacterium]
MNGYKSTFFQALFSLNVRDVKEGLDSRFRKNDRTGKGRDKSKDEDRTRTWKDSGTCPQ